MDLSTTITPKSTQRNADDLLSGPMTIKVTSVKQGPSVEQSVSISYEGDDGRPYLPCKSMRRILVGMWGKDGSAYIGKRLTIFNDKTVKWGGKAVGGIRISHAEIPEAFEMMLTETRGSKKPFRVEPLPVERTIDLTPYEVTGREQAALGMDALASWWKTVPKPLQPLLKPKLDNEWKAIAQNVTS